MPSSVSKGQELKDDDYVTVVCSSRYRGSRVVVAGLFLLFAGALFLLIATETSEEVRRWPTWVAWGVDVVVVQTLRYGFWLVTRLVLRADTELVWDAVRVPHCFGTHLLVLFEPPLGTMMQMLPPE